MTNSVYIAKRLLEWVFSPVGVMVLLLAAGFLWSVARRQSRGGPRLLVAGAFLFLLYYASPLANVMLGKLEREHAPLVNLAAVPKTDRIVVLAGYAEEQPHLPVTSRVSEQTLASLAEGLRLYRALPGNKLVTSGGVAIEGERPVAAAMADLLAELGVPREDLVIEGKSENTYENLFEVRALVGERPFILVASACDLRRAMGVARKLGLHAIPAPAYIRTLQRAKAREGLGGRVLDYVGRHVSLRNFAKLQWAHHEYAGYVWYRLLDRI